jgi:hypothetical protein
MRKGRFSSLEAGMVFALVFFAGSFLLYTLSFYGYLDPESRGFVALFDLLPVVAAAFSVAAVLALLRNFQPGDPPRLIWGLVLASLLLDLAAEFTWFAYESLAGVEVPYPSLADVFWLAAYLPFIAALVLILRGYRRLGLPLRKGAILACLVLVAAILALVTLSVTGPIFADAESTLAEKVINPAYVYLDLAILSLALLVAVTWFGGPQARQWLLVSSAFILFSVADIIFAHLSWHGNYSTGNHIDLLWLAGYLVMGMAALVQLDLLRKKKKEFAAPENHPDPVKAD